MLSPAPKLRYCILAYYVGLFLFGAVSAFFVRDMETALRTFWMDGLSFGLLPHALFFIALKSPGGWLDYSVVFGMSALIVLAALKLKGWPRNAAVIGLLLAAAAYGLVGARNFT